MRERSAPDTSGEHAPSLSSVLSHLRAALRALPIALTARLGMALTACLILAFRGEVPRYWPALAVALAWIVASTALALRGDRPMHDVGAYLGGRTAIVDTIVVVVAIAATDEADSPLRWVLLAAPAMWAWAEDRRVKLFVFLGGIGYAVAAVPDLVAGEADSLRVVAEFLLTYAGAAAIALATVHARRRDAEAELAVACARSEMLVEQARSQRQHQESIAARLHDGPLQMVIAARQDLDELLDGEEPDIEATREALTMAVASMRDLNRDLFEDVLRDAGLATAVRRAADQTRQNGGPPIAVEVAPEAVGPHDQLVLNIVNELLTNVRKHARASTASVAVDRCPSGWLRVTVADDGIGLTREAARAAGDHGHLGLRSIERRIGAAGGSVELEDVPRGTVVRVSLPGTPARPGADVSARRA